MAYDKVVDSSLLDTNLTIVANAIRSKGGTTENLSFPDGFVSAVQAIQTGDGGSGDSGGFVSGSFTPAESTLEMSVDIGKTYDYFIMFPDCSHNDLKVGLKTFFVFLYAKNNIFYAYSGNGGFAGSYYGASSISSKPTYNETSIDFANGTIGTNLGYFIAGTTYKWLAWQK